MHREVYTPGPNTIIFMKKKWDAGDISPQEGRYILITGANSGLGFYTSKILAEKGARVMMACRNMEKGEKARQEILKGNPSYEPELWSLDLSSLDSVRNFSTAFLEKHNKLDVLINNAGLMALPLERTREDFEMQLGVNHLAHFALTAQLWPALQQGTESRIIQVSSLAHRFGKMDFSDLNWEESYSKWGAYGRSKLANLLFIRELASRLEKSNPDIIAAAVHPGYANTELQAKGSRMNGQKLGAQGYTLANWLFAQSGERGALPSLYAATASGVGQGDYYGPDGLLKLKGFPEKEKPSSRALNAEDAARLWDVSEEMTGSRFQL